MRPQKVLDEDMIKGLMSVLRSKGYDGASLADLAKATGLKKASLYHRFPEGKQAMAKAVLNFVDEWIATNIYQELQNDSINRVQRLENILENIRVMYQDGEATCIFRALTMENSIQLFGAQIHETMQKWLDAFTEIGELFGFSKTTAETKALQAFINIQGSLIVAKGMNAPIIFKSALDSIRQSYVG